MVGILVSTLGLFRLVRMWRGRRGRERVNRQPAETS